MHGVYRSKLDTSDSTLCRIFSTWMYMARLYPICDSRVFRFIETSREVSALEAEMYRLSHYLHEEELLAQELQKMSILPTPEGAEVQGVENSDRKSLASILETVEGCSSVTAVPGRYLVHSGPLTELDPESSEDVMDVFAFLLNDSLMITTQNKKIRGPILYKFQSLLELDNMAVLSVPDTDFRKNAFRILLFPVSHTFRAASPAAKNQWKSLIEATKQKHKISLMAPRPKEKGDTPKTTPVFEHHREAMNAEDPADASKADWVKHVPENLDVFIAQREFEKAVSLVEQTRSFLKDCSDSHAHRDVRAKLGNRVSQLCNLLMKELEASPGGSLRGGPRAARKAIDHLLRLGRAAQACDLFLKNYTLLIRYESKGIKMEGATSLYITKLSKAFFSGLGTAADEFERAFTTNYGSYSAFVIWCMSELKDFCETFCEIVFSQASLSAVTECVVAACQECDLLEQKGLSLKHALMSELHSSLCQALTTAKDDVIATCTTKATAEKWEPMDFRKDSAQLSGLAREMENIGIADFKNLVIAGGIIDLSETTVMFCKLAFNYVTDILRFYVPELYEVFVDCFCDFSRHIVRVFQDALSKDEFLPATEFIQRNAAFTIGTVLPCVGLKIERHVQVSVPEIVDLIEELQGVMTREDTAPISREDVV